MYPTTQVTVKAFILVKILGSIVGGTLNGSVHNDRIVGGDNVHHGDAPFQVGLTQSTMLPIDYYCGGVLISPEWVLTAAHCVVNRPRFSVLVVAGDHNRRVLDGTEQYFYAMDVYVQEGYFNSNGKVDDIALIKLFHPFTLNNFVNTIKLHDGLWLPPVGTRAIATGWGVSVEGTPNLQPDILQKVTLVSIPWDTCIAISPDITCLIKDPNSMVDEQGTCFGDSGGPLVVEDEDSGDLLLVGIVKGNGNISIPCGHDEAINTFTQSHRHKAWICRTTGLC